jgi:hypothetical protein
MITRGMSRKEKISLDADEMQMRECRQLNSGSRKGEVMRTSSGIRKITAIDHTCVAKSIVFLRKREFDFE